MAKRTENYILDQPLDTIAAECNKMVACSAEPTTFTEANATFALADITLDGTDFTKADGDVSGRKVTVAAQTAVTVDTTGTATHVALVDTINSRLHLATTCTSQALTSGNTVNFPAWDIEFADPT